MKQWLRSTSCRNKSRWWNISNHSVRSVIVRIYHSHPTLIRSNILGVDVGDNDTLMLLMAIAMVMVMVTAIAMVMAMAMVMVIW